MSGKLDQLKFDFLGYEDDPALRSFLQLSPDRNVRRFRQRALVKDGGLGRQLLKVKGQVDVGQSAYRAISKNSGYEPWIVKALSCCAPVQAGTVDFTTTAYWLSHIIPEHAPKPTEWSEFCDVMETVEKIADLTGISVAQLLGKEPAWVSLAEKVGSKLDTVRSVLDSFLRMVFLPEVYVAGRRQGFQVRPEVARLRFQDLAGNTRLAIARAVFGDKTLAGILEAQGKWWKGTPLSLPGGDAPRALLKFLPNWHALLPTIPVDDHHVVVPLTTPEALLADGLEMGHCLGRYALKCAFDRGYAISIRTGGGYRLSSAVLNLGRDMKISVVDHRSAQNYTPDPRATAALKIFISQLDDPAIKSRWVHENSQRNLVHGGNCAETQLLYQFYFAPAREWVFKAYHAPTLTKECATLSRAEWLKLSGLCAHAEAIARGHSSYSVSAAA